MVDAVGRQAGPAIAETHISVVILMGDRAYKVLKPIRTPFLDNSTPQRRLANATAEVELNRRMAPDVYLGLLDVVRDGEPVDHVIEMRRMPQDRRLTALLTTSEAPEQLRRVARVVAAFHAAQPVTDTSAAAASHEQVVHRWRQNLEEMAALAPAILPTDRLDAVAHLADRYLEHRQPLFDQRIRDGHAREGHGDLLADDIFCLDDGPRILDCLAFDEGLRVGDVLADIAFLVMDVERLASHDLARRLLGWYQEFSGEHHPASLAHHYVAYRALVRAKVTALRAQQGGATAADAAAHLGQAHRHLDHGQVRLVLVGGRPGTGKSTLADALSTRLGAVVERSDELRKDLAGIGHTDRPVNELGAGIYDHSHSRRTYQELIERAGRLLVLGESVILDARWSEVWQRQLAREVAHRSSAQLVELECRLPADIARKRIRARIATASDASDVTPEMLDTLATQHADWPQAVPCHTTKRAEDVVDDLVPRILSTEAQPGRDR